jgi:hypothetical protein
VEARRIHVAVHADALDGFLAEGGTVHEEDQAKTEDQGWSHAFLLLLREKP